MAKVVTELVVTFGVLLMHKLGSLLYVQKNFSAY